jgi:hypothetical protein
MKDHFKCTENALEKKGAARHNFAASRKTQRNQWSCSSHSRAHPDSKHKNCDQFKLSAFATESTGCHIFRGPSVYTQHLSPITLHTALQRRFSQISEFFSQHGVFSHNELHCTVAQKRRLRYCTKNPALLHISSGGQSYSYKVIPLRN